MYFPKTSKHDATFESLKVGPASISAGLRSQVFVPARNYSLAGSPESHFVRQATQVCCCADLRRRGRIRSIYVSPSFTNSAASLRESARPKSANTWC
jgi:hypothetical protein